MGHIYVQEIKLKKCKQQIVNQRELSAGKIYIYTYRVGQGVRSGE